MENLFDIKKDATGPDYVSFEEIENAFSRPTQYQHFFEQPSPGPQYEPSPEFPEDLVDPDGSARDPESVPDDASPVVDHEHALRTGERIAKLIDTGIDFTLSNFIARNGESYHADERDLKDIAEAWGEISEERQWNIGPEMTLVILYVMVYGPLVKQAVTDRRLAVLEQRQNEMQAQIDMLRDGQQPQPHQQPEKPVDDGNTETKPNPFNYAPAKG